jgi:hypothetical protein
MKPRARRVTIAAAVLGTGVVAGLAIAHWGVVRDHVQAWHLQLTRETVTIEPDPVWEARPLETRSGLRKLTAADPVLGMLEHPGDAYFVEAESLLQVLANSSGHAVILRPTASSPWMLSAAWLKSANTDAALLLLRNYGWRIIEQRFPRRAYVVVISKFAWDPLEEEEKATPAE